MDSQIVCHGLDTPTQVFFYEQDYYVLSNFSSFRVHIWDHDFDTAEHAYHWVKFDGYANDVARLILDAPSAHAAFTIAQEHKVKRRPDWDANKEAFMLQILQAKVAQHEYVERKLLATGHRELIENSWRDSYWGWGPDGNGQNRLGRLWEMVRMQRKIMREPVVAKKKELPDPAAVMGAAMSLYKLNSREDCETSDVFQGHDVFMRLCMDVATAFENWACSNVNFDALTDLWPYLLHDHFLGAVEEVMGPLKGEDMRKLEGLVQVAPADAGFARIFAALSKRQVGFDGKGA